MKVVLFCGGLGMRLRDYSETIPKPMVRIGGHPILWYVMKYFAHYGHTDFVLCLGYRGEVIREFFLNYNEAMSNDFVMENGGAQIQLFKSDIHNWRITFVDTGQNANIGQRLLRVRPHLDGEEMFLANYSDGLTDLPLDKYVDSFLSRRKTASFLSVHPTTSFHVVKIGRHGLVDDIRPVHSSLLINSRYFIFRNSIFDYIHEGEELVVEPFQRLIKHRQLVSYQYDGFWKCMDTFKDKQEFDDMFTRGQTPWICW